MANMNYSRKFYTIGWDEKMRLEMKYVDIIYLQLCSSKTSPTQFFGLFFWSKVYLFAWANFNQLHKSLSYIKSLASKNARASCISQYHVSPSSVIFTWILLSQCSPSGQVAFLLFVPFQLQGLLWQIYWKATKWPPASRTLLLSTFCAKILLFYLNGQPSN